MYSIFEELCEIKGVTPYRVAQETGVTTATLTSWKKGKYKPKQDKLQKIADYLGVSVDYLMTGKEPTVENTFGSEYAELVGKIRNDIELSRALLKYFDLPDTKKNHVIELINLLSE